LFFLKKPPFALKQAYVSFALAELNCLSFNYS
jgi:hypothetical protein